MKNLIFFSLALAMLLFTSCEKDTQQDLIADTQANEIDTIIVNQSESNKRANGLFVTFEDLDNGSGNYTYTIEYKTGGSWSTLATLNNSIAFVYLELYGDYCSSTTYNQLRVTVPDPTTACHRMKIKYYVSGSQFNSLIQQMTIGTGSTSDDTAYFRIKEYQVVRNGTAIQDGTCAGWNGSKC